jgi:hypothetical protein
MNEHAKKIEETETQILKTDDLSPDLEGGEGESAVDVYDGADHKRGPAPRPRAIFRSESTDLMDDIESEDAPGDHQ